MSYAVLMPENGLSFGALGPLLAVRVPGERRTVAIHYEVLSARASARPCSGSGSAPASCATSSPAAVSPPPPPTNGPALGARDQEYAVAAGAALVRFAVAASVTVPSSWPVEDHAARLENDAAGRARLLRLELAQDSAFVAAVLPVGIGLPRQRGALR